MKFEYLIFNLVVLFGPLILSFDKKVHYYTEWPRVFKSMTIPLIIFIIWDSIVAGRHWWFNHAYTLDFRLLNLPVGEWLFFITIPYSTLFIWEVLHAYFKNRYFKERRVRVYLAFLMIIMAVPLFYYGKEYTALVSIEFGAVLMLDKILKTRILNQSLSFYYLGIIFCLMFIFNGYLTARPVVLYGVQYQLNLRIFTIPIEDFIYGFTHLLFCTIIYEKLIRKENG